MLDALGALREDDAGCSGDSAPLGRIAQAELAFRMQVSAPP
jgi:hypothetical protein